MKRWFALVLLLLCTACAEGASSFVAYDVFVDAGDDALAVYQIDLSCPNADIVGIEGGEGVFHEPPVYDPKALQGRRVVIAAFTHDPDPPRGRVRVARLHLLQHGALFAYETLGVTAAKPGGERITVEIEILPVGENK